MMSSLSSFLTKLRRVAGLFPSIGVQRVVSLDEEIDDAEKGYGFVPALDQDILHLGEGILRQPAVPACRLQAQAAPDAPEIEKGGTTAALAP